VENYGRIYKFCSGTFGRGFKGQGWFRLDDFVGSLMWIVHAAGVSDKTIKNHDPDSRIFDG
jgi:hypothetical protein